MTAPQDHRTPLEHRVAVAGALLRTGMRRLGFYGAALGLLGGFAVLTGVGGLAPSVAQAANPSPATNTTVTVTTTKRVTTVADTTTLVTTLFRRATTLTTVTSPLKGTVSLTSTSSTTTNFGVTIRIIHGTTTTGT